MEFLYLLSQINYYLDVPVSILFFAVGIFLTVAIGFPQIRAFGRFISFARQGFARSNGAQENEINPFHALFTAMSTSIGIGTIVGPSLAIVVGGPGALFWLIVYSFFGSVTKLTEVVYAMRFREITASGVIGGPGEYLKRVHPLIASWYGLASLFLLAGWSGIQSKALSEILILKSVPEWISGLGLAVLVFFVLVGGAQRVGQFASKIVPIMFVLYVVFASWILLVNGAALMAAIKLVMHSILSPAAPVSGFIGATVFAALREGTYKSVFITEAGMGTSSIPHSLSDAKRPIDQGILAMYSVAADTFLCILSGLLVLVTGAWMTNKLTTVLVFKVFEAQLPFLGPWFFITSVILFILTTTIGNSFNGGQNFAIFTKYRYINWYYGFVCLVIFISAIADLTIVWAVSDVLLPLVAIPNLLGILWLAVTYPDELRI